MDRTRDPTTAPKIEPALEAAALLVFETEERTLRTMLEREVRLMDVWVITPVVTVTVPLVTGRVVVTLVGRAVVEAEVDDVVEANTLLMAKSATRRRMVMVLAFMEICLKLRVI